MSLAQEPALGPDEAQVHLQRLTASWNILADLCFADLLLLVPAPGTRPRAGADRFVVYGQMRPTTIQTIHNEDLVGRVIDQNELPLVARAWKLGQIVEGEISIAGPGEQRRVQCIPVRRKDELVGVLTREAPLAVGGRRPGQLERIYVEVFDRLARMISAGEFPFAVEDAPTAESPRVGDGVVILDSTGRVEYASPNAVNALHRMGIYTSLYGARLDEIGVDETAIQKSFHEAVPVTEEIERHPAVIVLLRCIPLLEAGEVTGALVLSRDITDLRRRDRLLLSKDATIREVHHRVKNNLQVVSSLLDLQADVAEEPRVRAVFEESQDRIQAMALIHESLYQSDTLTNIDAAAYLRNLSQRLFDASRAPGSHIALTLETQSVMLPPQTAIPFGLLLNELLSNALKHAFPGDRSGTIHIALRQETPGQCVLTVRDTGVGFPEGLNIHQADSLGLQLVGLLTEQLGGTVALARDGGTIFTITFPV
jgi:two-component system, sensor histidine kinase PdtaS